MTPVKQTKPVASNTTKIYCTTTELEISND